MKAAVRTAGPRVPGRSTPWPRWPTARPATLRSAPNTGAATQETPRWPPRGRAPCRSSGSCAARAPAPPTVEMVRGVSRGSPASIRACTVAAGEYARIALPTPVACAGRRPPVRDGHLEPTGAEDLDVDDVDPVEHREVDALAGRLAQVLHHRQGGLGQRAVPRHQLTALEEPHPQPVAVPRRPGLLTFEHPQGHQLACDPVHRRTSAARCAEPARPGSAPAPRSSNAPTTAAARASRVTGGRVPLSGTHSLIEPRSRAHCQPIDPPGKGANSMSIVASGPGMVRHDPQASAGGRPPRIRAEVGRQRPRRARVLRPRRRAGGLRHRPPARGRQVDGPPPASDPRQPRLRRAGRAERPVPPRPARLRARCARPGPQRAAPRGAAHPAPGGRQHRPDRQLLGARRPRRRLRRAHREHRRGALPRPLRPPAALAHHQQWQGHRGLEPAGRPRPPPGRLPAAGQQDRAHRGRLAAVPGVGAQGGYAVSHGESFDGASSVAVPVIFAPRRDRLGVGVRPDRGHRARRSTGSVPVLVAASRRIARAHIA